MHWIRDVVGLDDTRETDHGYGKRMPATMIRAKPMQIYERRLFKPICTVARIRINPSLSQPSSNHRKGGARFNHPVPHLSKPHVFGDNLVGRADRAELDVRVDNGGITLSSLLAIVWGEIRGLNQ